LDPFDEVIPEPQFLDVLLFVAVTLDSNSTLKFFARSKHFSIVSLFIQE